MPRTVTDIDKEIELLKAKRAALVARESNAQRRIRTRKAAILGGWIMANDPHLAERIASRLVRDQDRRAFGLPAIGHMSSETSTATTDGENKLS